MACETDNVVFDEDNPEWTEEDFTRAKPVNELPAHVRNAFPKMRGPQREPTKQQVTLRLDPDVLAKFRATGAGWQARMNAVLKAANV